MRYALRWWETLGKSERIVAMSLAAGSVVAISSSTAWAVAVSYMTKQKARVAIAGSTQRDGPPAAAPNDAANGHVGAEVGPLGVR
jgi:hypothetical protein